MNFVNQHLASPESMIPNYGRIASERNKNWRHTVCEYISNLERDYHVSIDPCYSLMEAEWTADEIRAEYEQGISFALPAYDKFEVFADSIDGMECFIRESRYPTTEDGMSYLRFYLGVINKYAPALASELELSLSVDAFASLFLKEEEEENLMPIPTKSNKHQHDRYTCMKREKAALHDYHERTGRYTPSSYNRKGYMKDSYKRGNRKVRKEFDLPSGKSGWKKLGSCTCVW